MENMIKHFGYAFNKFSSFETAGIINNQASKLIGGLKGSFVNQGKKSINEQKHHPAPIYPGIILHAIKRVFCRISKIAGNKHPHTLIGNGHD